MQAVDLIRAVEKAGGHLERDGEGLVIEAASRPKARHRSTSSPRFSGCTATAARISRSGTISRPSEIPADWP